MFVPGQLQATTSVASTLLHVDNGCRWLPWGFHNFCPVSAEFAAGLYIEVAWKPRMLYDAVPFDGLVIVYSLVTRGLDQWRVSGFDPKTVTHCGTCKARSWLGRSAVFDRSSLCEAHGARALQAKFKLREPVNAKGAEREVWLLGLERVPRCSHIRLIRP